jgi:hypothetical protein
MVIIMMMVFDVRRNVDDVDFHACRLYENPLLMMSTQYLERPLMVVDEQHQYTCTRINHM